MNRSRSAPAAPSLIRSQALQRMIELLLHDGLRVVGPTVRDHAVVYDDIASIDDLPRGWGDEQAPGHYALRRRDDDALFGFNVGPHSWKRFLLPARQTLWSLRRYADGTMRLEQQPEAPRPLAILGARACELHALDIHDRVLRDGAFAEADYCARREACVIIAVQCTQAGGNCFCASMDSGPRARGGFDLALTELPDAQGFVVDVGSDAGAALLARVEHAAADAAQVRAARERVERTAREMPRSMPLSDAKAVLQRKQQHPRWDDVATRCLGCGNCTMVCPTCFCTSVDDHTDLDMRRAWRERHWDSCFTTEFGHVHGGSVRSSLAARYRHWLSHKMAHWVDEFGSSGCVGCGRCITWCPVGIDILDELRAIGGAPEAQRTPHDANP